MKSFRSIFFIVEGWTKWEWSTECKNWNDSCDKWNVSDCTNWICNHINNACSAISDRLFIIIFCNEEKWVSAQAAAIKFLLKILEWSDRFLQGFLLCFWVFSLLFLHTLQNCLYSIFGKPHSLKSLSSLSRVWPLNFCSSIRVESALIFFISVKKAPVIFKRFIAWTILWAHDWVSYNWRHLTIFIIFHLVACFIQHLIHKLSSKSSSSDSKGTNN